MKDKEFDELFAQKLGQIKPIKWKKQEVWQQIEQRKQDRKIIYWKHYSIAACLVLFLTCFHYWIPFDTKHDFQSKIHYPKKEQSFVETNDTDKKSESYQKISLKKKKDTNPIQPATNFSIPILNYNLLRKTTEINAIESKTNIAKMDSFKFQNVENNINTIVLEIPLKQEFKSKKNYVARVFQQLGRFNREGKFDWTEVNIRPKKVWILVKESFKPATQEKDSITIQKNIKL